MKKKEKFVLTSMGMLFAISSGFFYYTNFYTDKIAERNKGPVLVATRDISKGASLNEENTEIKRIDTEEISQNYIQNFDDITELVATADIYQDEKINSRRVSSKLEEKGYNLYKINLKPDFSSKLNKGDLIKVYVQFTDSDGNISNKLVFDKKEVLEILELDPRTNLHSFSIEATDKESISYHNSKEMGKIIVLKYTETSQVPDIDMPLVDISEKKHQENTPEVPIPEKSVIFDETESTSERGD